jgi:putative membrane protein
MSPTTIRRGALVLLLDAAILLLLSGLLPGFVLDGAGAALGAAALIGLLNAFVWPLLARLALPLTVLTLGLAALVLNGVLVTFAVNLIPGAEVSRVLDGIVITLVVAALTAAVYSLLAIDEDDAWHRNVVRRQARRRGQVVETDVPGVTNHLHASSFAFARSNSSGESAPFSFSSLSLCSSSAGEPPACWRM